MDASASSASGSDDSGALSPTGYEDEQRGEFHARMPRFALPEFDAISHTFNAKAYVSTEQILLHMLLGFRVIKEHVLSAYIKLITFGRIIELKIGY
jgi:hypothetical protein